MNEDDTPIEVKRCREYDQAFSDRIPPILRQSIIYFIIVGIVIILMCVLIRIVLDG